MPRINKVLGGQSEYQEKESKEPKASIPKQTRVEEDATLEQWSSSCSRHAP